ncbi:MAG: isoprenylcysteine carboxylmethyltransferase family protein, partial [Deltaproteobacteria bacterium]
FFLGLGFSIAAGNIFFPIIFIILFFFIYHATIEQEEAFLSNKFGEVYAYYKAKTSRFFPTPSSIRNSVKGTFSWKLVKKHREYNTWIGILIGILLLVVKFLAV